MENDGWGGGHDGSRRSWTLTNQTSNLGLTANSGLNKLAFSDSPGNHFCYHSFTEIQKPQQLWLQRTAPVCKAMSQLNQPMVQKSPSSTGEVTGGGLGLAQPANKQQVLHK